MMQQSGKRRGTQQNDPERAVGDTGTTWEAMTQTANEERI